MQEAWRAYLDVALGFTEASRKRAMKVAKKLVGRGGATAEQLQSMAEDLVNTSAANRESLVRLVRFELDRALGRVGLATAEEVSQLTKRVRELEEELRLARASGGPAVVAAADDELAASAPPGAPAPAKVVRKAVAKKAVAGANGAAPAKAAPAKTATPAAPAKATAPVKAAAPAKATTAAPAKVTVTPAKAAPSKAVAKKTAAKTPATMPAKKTTPAKAADGGTTGTQP
jgi:polyhydroxyalkanoate synthesis regulator phasin